MVEISINNLLHPPLPERDTIDDALWGLVAVLIVVATSIASYRRSSFEHGLSAGIWLGLSSGAVACATGLIFATVGIHTITSDPLSRREWASAPHGGATISSHLAYQTLGGALLHLIALGVVMGCILGSLGGLAGYRRAARH